MRDYGTNYIINNIILKSHIRAYFKYVNDTFILCRGLIRQAENMVKYLNNINKQIQFILEKRLIIPTFNFLDLLVNIMDSKFEYSTRIYRKPTALTDAIVPHDSNHPHSQKVILIFDNSFTNIFVFLTYTLSDNKNAPNYSRYTLKDVDFSTVATLF